MADDSANKGSDGSMPYSTRNNAPAFNIDDSAALATDVENIATANGMATLVAKKEFDRKLVLIQGLFRPREQNGQPVAEKDFDKGLVDRVLTYYFAVHGTSPETEWAAYEHPIVVGTVSVPPMKVVSIIGVGKLKQFMGRYTSTAIKMCQASSLMTSALSDRAARQGLPAGQEYMAIDFVGKDGSLSHAEAGQRQASRNNALSYRSANMYGLSQKRDEDRIDKVNSSNDARALSPARPLINY